MNFSRPVKARAMRSACMLASVPVLERRTLSMWVIRVKRSATSISTGVVAAKRTPFWIASATRRVTSGWACPRMMGPKPSR